MEGSKERIDFIIEYISAYEAKIKIANKNSLFDEAQLFELFAQEICNLWYGKKFTNLNSIKKNYPCVDLLSEDGEIYVQVSTQEDIPGKIKKTLLSLEEEKYPELSNISAPVFFVLSNDTEQKVKDLVGKNQIGRFPFSVKDNFVSTSMIVQRACNDIEFQKSLYDFLKYEIDGISSISSKLLNIFDISKNVGLSNINTMINGEYEIDRSSLLKSIQDDDAQFKVVCGDAGSGKSAICKKVLMEEEMVIFARAEKIASCDSINNIWDLDVVEALKYLGEKKAVIYLDALEYISSASEFTKDLLQSLLYEIKKHPTVSFVTSCRTCDVGAFIKLIGLFDFKKYVVEDISNTELKQISEKYPVIRAMSLSGKYSELLRSPFYIDVIISQGIDIDKAGDVNEFRDYIWKNCICLNEKSIKKGFRTNDVASIIEKLVVERSKRFSPGVRCDELDCEILDFLKSNNVITVNENLARLKYDIYEDICFERLFDREFDLSRGNYAAFFACVESMGQGAYRRYQIWVSNKLLARSNRDKFLKSLVFDNDISSEWSRNTIIGLIKSPYCKSFFDEQGINILEHARLEEFIKITNCFAFEMGDVHSIEYDSISILRLNASGYGRLALIGLIYKYKEYEDRQLESKITKLCSDYVLRSRVRDDEVDKYAFEIMKYYVDSFLQDGLSAHIARTLDYLTPRLEVIYALPKIARSWTIDFWKMLQSLYVEDESKTRIAAEIISWTLDHATQPLVDGLCAELFKIAETIWIEENKRDIISRQLYGDGISRDFQWGVRGEGKDYHYKHQNVNNEIFLRLIYQRKFKDALIWTITLINKFVSIYSAEDSNRVEEIVLFDSAHKSEKKYLGSVEMWFSGREENMIPTLIGDMVYWLRESAIQILHVCEEDSELFNHFATYIKEQIMEKSTNVILLTVIEDIAFEFKSSLPAYAIELASSLEVISWDIQWQVHRIMTPEKKLLLDQIKLAVGIPDFNGRYSHRETMFRGIQDYMAWCQLTAEKEDVREKCISTLTYLYEKIDSKDAHALLQVQKMDMRNANVRIIEDKYISIEPKLSKETQEIVDANEKNNEPQNEVLTKFKDVIDKKADIHEVHDLIEQLESLMQSPEDEVRYEDYYILALCVAFRDDNLAKEKRKEYVNKWLDRIENLHSGNSYVADLKLSAALIAQYSKDIGDESRNRLKRFMVACLMNSGANGQIGLLRNLITTYLFNNPGVARIFFNTIICCAHDEWNHTIYNQKIMKKCRRKTYSIPAAYGLPKPDDIVKAYGKKVYVSKKDSIIEDYLYKEKSLDLSAIKIEELDPGLLFVAMNVGLKLSDSDFVDFAKKVMPIFIKELSEDNRDSIMNTYYQRLDFKKLFERELGEDNGSYQEAINLLFDNVNYQMFSNDTIKAYISIFEHVGALYFDSYENDGKRIQLRKCLEYAESFIDRIQVPFVKNGLERILIFDYERFGSNWNKCTTHYSSNDKTFLCRLWGKYHKGHEKDVVMSMYQMKFDELLPEVLPVLAEVVEALYETGEVSDKNCVLILKSIVLKVLLKFSDVVKADQDYHDAYERILNALIKCNDESAAVILDEYRTH